MLVFLVALICLMAGVILGALFVKHQLHEKDFTAKIEALTEENGLLKGRLEGTAEDANHLNDVLALQKSELSQTLGELISNKLADLTRTATATLSEQAGLSYERMIKPVDDQLSSLNKQLTEFDTSSKTQLAQLAGELLSLRTQEIPNLRKETQQLVTALSRPGTRGSWGELQLRRVIELAGMLEHCDFETQPTFAGSNSSLRPDVVVNLPGDRRIVIDAKVPLDSLLSLDVSSSEQQRQVAQKAHAEALRKMVTELSKRDYGAQITNSIDFVVLFVPGEAFFYEALAADPALLDFALSHAVVIASPVTLLPLLKAVAYGWHNADVEQHAKTALELASTLNERLRVFVDHYNKVGTNLAGAVNAYNRSQSSYSSRVLPQLRRLEDITVGTTLGSAIESTPIDIAVNGTDIVREGELP